MKQYCVVLPLSVDEYQKGLKYMDYLIDFDLSKQTQQKVELISQVHLLDDIPRQTPYIKMYFLSNYLPEFVYQLANQKQLAIQERRFKIDAGEQRVFNVTPSFKLSNQSTAFPGVEVTLAMQISAGAKTTEVIDAITEPLDYFRGYEKDVQRKLRDCFGILEVSNWKKYCSNLSTCTINAQVAVNYGEESGPLEQYFYDQVRKFVLYFFKSDHQMLFTYKAWSPMTESEIFRHNKQVLVSQSGKSLQHYPLSIYTTSDLLNKTNFKELKKLHLSRYSVSSTSLMKSTGTPAKVSQVLESRSSPLSEVKRQLVKKRAGSIFKKGDGPIDYNWNQRYVVLDGETLIYFKDKFDKVPRGVINLRESYVSGVSTSDDRDHCFYIEAQSKLFYFSGETKQETEAWREDIQQATLESTSKGNQHKPSYACINTYLLTDVIPTELQKYTVIRKLDDLAKEWQFRKFRNGVKIYEKPLPNGGATQSWKKQAAKIFVVCALGLMIYMTMDQYLLTAAVIGLLTLAFTFQRGLLSSSQSYQVYGRMISDIDAQKAFELLKNLKNKQIIDPNFIQVNKVKSSENIEFQKKGVGHFIIYPIRQKQIVQNPQIIQLSITRYRFILKDSSSFVVDISMGHKFQMVEIYEVQRIPKVSGKSILNYYCEIKTQLSKKNLYQKYLLDKVQNLSLISQAMDEQRFHQFQQSIVNELQVKRNSVVLHNNYDEQLSVIQQLKSGSCSTRGKKLEERMPGYRRYKEGGVECYNRQEIKSQDGLVLDLMRQAGKQLFEGKNIISVSLPVRIFEPRSMIERICDWWGFVPVYLDLALQSNDCIERFKCVVTMAVAGFYIGGRQKKPFNPILGETYQGSWQDGTQIFIEHTSHHPPVSHFFVEHAKKQYKFYGHYEYQAKLRYNAVVGHQTGETAVEFADGQKIVYSMPPAKVSGLIFGARLLEWCNSFKFTDRANGLVCEIKFSEGAGMLIGRQAKPTDYFEGTLTQGNRMVSKIYGSWLEAIYWDNTRYWDIEKLDPAVIVKATTPLPSDCRFRTDLIELANGDLEKAQEEKTRLEVLQRRDRQLRNEYKARRHR